MTAALRLVAPPPRSPLETLRAISPPLLAAGPVLRFTHTARVGGGRACRVPGCVRSAREAQLCRPHRGRWRAAGQPALSSWAETGSVGPDQLQLGSLPEQLALEFAYAIRRADASGWRLSFSALEAQIRKVRTAGVHSLLELETTARPDRRGLRAHGFLPFAIDALDELMGTASAEHEYARESWRLRRLGFSGHNERLVLHFDPIPQDWLRETAKRFLRWRINAGHSASGLHRDLITLTRLANAVTDVAGPAATPAQLDRAVIERLLSLFIEDGLTANGRSMALASVRMFLSTVRQHNWLPGLHPHAAVYPDDVPRRTALPPRALSEFVMAQLEQPTNLARITDDRYRLLIPLLMQTGLRQKDARLLPPDCLVTDSRNAPYLRYFNHKMNREALIPISAELAAAITTQRTRLLERHPDATFLFAAQSHNGPRAGLKPPSSATLRVTLKHWLTDCDVRDEHGQPVPITPHQFRHTLGTHLINNDVPQEIVRQLLDHSSTEMTAHYARLHDTTVREHWERARKVNIAGQPVELPDDSPLATASWMNQHLARATMALPNGYCGLPLQQNCPHANACLSCPVFITTAEFLPQHREQLAHTRTVLDTAKSRNQLRLIEINQRVHNNLTNIITALETEAPDAC